MGNRTFYTFASNSENVYTDSEFQQLTERETGFQPNTPANSKLANTALMASTKFIKALINAFWNSGSQQVPGDIGPNSSEESIESYWTLGLEYYLNNNINFSISKSTSQNVDTFTFNIGTKQQVITNIKAQTAQSAQSADTATNVSGSIGNTSIEDIFEDDGATVKMATESTKTQSTDFTNQAFSSVDVNSLSKTISLVDGATYQVYVQYESTVLSTSIVTIEILNFGTFVHFNGVNNIVGLRFRETETRYLLGLSISSENVIKLFNIDESLTKTRVISNTTSAITDKYTLYYRRIK